MEPALNDRTRQAPAAPDPLRHLLDPDYPLCREDLIWALDYIKRKVADGAPEWTGLDRPQLLAHFAAYANLAMHLLHRQSLCGEDTEQLRAMLRDTLALN
ncbi:hypothetical protein COLU111180_05085 [Cohnella lubricantis]|uniref:Uncharacterized protein n=1 Tax=Cohnella lubricantis TaxID=2163172 RepID=A0A841TD32_9BACL|nr:hypothetical protein [Cohnella lubricantis]MBB6677258.1 hypothetical protein [Cohnella lubricantis]MBP2116931.1 hypothetical protein [Cohnella lubricantis]